MNRKTVLGLAAIVVAVLAYSYLRPTPQTEPPAAEDEETVLTGDPIATVALPAELSADALIGKLGYEAKCAVCHGENAAGQAGIAPPLVHNLYRPAHHSDTAILLATKIGVRAHHWNFGSMFPIKGLTDAEVGYIVTYIRELQRENGIF